MDVNEPALAIVGVLLIALLVFLIIRNRKDRKKLEDQLNVDYKKPREEEHTSDPDDLKNT